MSGIKWGDVKDYEKMVLADICARCETFYFTAHLGTVWGGDKKPTGQMKAKGKESLMQLASLYLWFDRSPDPKTGIKPGPPSAHVMKGRLEIGEVIDGEVVSYEVLPPRLPVATPKAIRDYFKNPAGKKGLSEGEKIKEVVLSSDERLKLEVQKAEAERDAAIAKAAVSQSQQVTRVVIQGEPIKPVSQTDENTNSPQAWEINFTHAIKQAATHDELNTLPAQIKLARSNEFIGDEHMTRLKALFTERQQQLGSPA
jgi:hypothetical protein